MGERTRCECPACGATNSVKPEGAGVGKCRRCGAALRVRRPGTARSSAQALVWAVVGVPLVILFIIAVPAAVTVAAVEFGWVGGLLTAAAIFATLYSVRRWGGGPLSPFRRLLGGYDAEEEDPALRDLQKGDLVALVKREVFSEQRSWLGAYIAACGVLSVVGSVAVFLTGVFLLDFELPQILKSTAGSGVVIFCTGLALAPNRVYRDDRVKRIVGTRNPYIARACCVLAAVVFGLILAGMAYARQAKLERMKGQVTSPTKERSKVRFEE